MSRIAIVGGGISGIGAARKLLQEGFNVLLFEASSQLGGIGAGIEITDKNGSPKTIDCSVNHYNPHQFPEFSSFVNDLGLATTNLNQNITFMRHTGEPLWSAFEDHPQFHDKACDIEALRKDISRINREADAILRNDSHVNKRAQDFLKEEGYSQAFQEFFFYPLAIGCFSMPNMPPENYPIQSLVRYWTLTGILGHPVQPKKTIVGGMNLYSQRFQKWFFDEGGYLFTNTKVLGIARQRSYVIVKALSQNGQQLSFKVDHVIMANRACDIIDLIEDIGPRERAIFSQFIQHRVRMCIHTDTSFLPTNRACWGDSNYIVPSPDILLPKPTLTLHPRMLVKENDLPDDLLISINPSNEPQPSKILSDHFFNYPIPNNHNENLAFKVQDIQGTKRTWYCGSYFGYGFHEDGLKSAINLIENFKI